MIQTRYKGIENVKCEIKNVGKTFRLREAERVMYTVGKDSKGGLRKK